MSSISRIGLLLDAIACASEKGVAIAQIGFLL